MSPSQLAETLGISPQDLRNYENGTERIPASLLFAIAEAFDTDIGVFFQDEAGAPPLSETASPERAIDVAIVGKLSELGDSPAKQHIYGILATLVEYRAGGDTESS